MRGFLLPLAFFFAWQAFLSKGGSLSYTCEDTSCGSYNVYLNNQSFLASGDLFFRNNGIKASLILSSAQTVSGMDPLGAYTANEATWQDSFGTTYVTRIKAYNENAAVLVFSQQWTDGASQAATGDRDTLISAFPSFVVPSTGRGSAEFGFTHFAGFMAGGTESQFGQWGDSALESGALQGGVRNSGVLCLFNKSLESALVISPLNNFMAFNMHVEEGFSGEKQVQFGVMGNVSSVPSGFELEFVLAATDGGVNEAMRNWGKHMLQYYGKPRGESRARDFTLRYLGYSTDNGAFYYYNTEEDKNYEQTIDDVRSYADEQGIAYRYILLDSWWYYKGYQGGLANWTARPDVFPNGMQGVYEETGWLVQAHSRWFSGDTVYADNPPLTPSGGYSGKTFTFTWGTESEKYTGLPTQSEFWEYLFDINEQWGLTVYEQDWLSTTTDRVPEVTQSATFGREWLLQMGRAAQDHDLSIQYCMSYPRHVLTSLELSAATQARASDDYHPSNDQWKIGVSALFTDSIDVAPSKDNYWSEQTPQYDPHYSTSSNVSEPRPRLQSVVSSIGNGPVQPSDQIGYSDAQLIMRCCNAGGLLLRPEQSATGIDRYFLEKAFHDGSGPVGELYSTHAEIGAGHSFVYVYVLGAYLERDFDLELQDVEHHLQGSTTPQFLAYEANATNKFAVFDETHPLTFEECDGWTFQYFSFVPVFPELSKGWYLQGETNKWIGASSERFESIVVSDDGSVSAEFIGFQNEKLGIGFVNYETFEQKIVECVVHETLHGSVSIDSQGNAKCSDL